MLKELSNLQALKKRRLISRILFHVARYYSLGNIIDALQIWASLGLGYLEIMHNKCTHMVSCPNENGFRNVLLPDDVAHNIPLPELRVLVFVCYWVKMQGSFTAAETIALKVLPIIESFTSIRGLLLWTLMVWLICSQVLYILRMNDAESWTGSISETFYFLFVGDAEVVDPYSGSDYTMTRSSLLPILILMVILFSTWILNIFIGVISDSFNDQKEKVVATFTQARAQGVKTYLLRASRLPSEIFPPLGSRKSNLILISAVSLCFLVMVLAFAGLKLPSMVSIPLFTVLVLVLELVPFQTKDAPWATKTRAPGLHYLWLVKVRKDTDDADAGDSEDEEEEASSVDSTEPLEKFKDAGKDVVLERKALTAMSSGLR
jgi:hypothetical protein